MKAYLDAVLDSILAGSPGAIVGVILAALVGTLPMAIAHAATRRRAKDTAMILVGTAMAGNLIILAALAGYFRLVPGRVPTPSMAGRPGPAPGAPGYPPPFGPPPGWPGPGSPHPDHDHDRDRFSRELALIVLDGADADGDGLVSAPEAASDAARLVGRSAGEGEGSVDGAGLRRAIRALLAGPGEPGGTAAIDADEARMGPGQGRSVPAAVGRDEDAHNP